MTFEEFPIDQKFDITITKSNFTHVIAWTFTSLWEDVICVERIVVKQWLEFDMKQIRST